MTGAHWEMMATVSPTVTVSSGTSSPAPCVTRNGNSSWGRSGNSSWG